MNSANFGIKLWFKSEDDTAETLIVDADGLDDRVGGGMDTSTGIRGLAWNAYANANQGVGGETPTTETTYRYEDNVHITAGPPVSCAQIGFARGSPPPPDATPPAAPKGLQIKQGQ